jgi:hypothetical protein
MRARRLLLFLLLLATPAWAQEPPSRLTTSILAAGASLGMMEIVGSEACIQQGSCREGNPVLPDGTGWQATAGRSAIKAAGTAGAVILLAKLRTRHPRWALAGSIAFAGFNGWLAVNAFDYLRKGQVP